MNYLAFDIEAANGYKPYSICSIGFVLSDEKFNVLNKFNLWINPKTKYNLNGTRKNVGIDLHLDKALLDSSPDFTQAYSQIKSLLTDPNVQVVGHAVESDVIMLNAACKHYALPSLDLKFICSQLLFKLYKKEKDVRGLNKIADEMGIEFNQHNSMEDALMSLMTLKYLVGQTGRTVAQLLQDYHVRIGSNENFTMTRTVSLDGQVSLKSVRNQAEGRIADFINTSHFTKLSDCLAKHTFAIARSIELDFDVVKTVLSQIYTHGGSYTTKLSNCQYYIKNYSFDQPTKVDVMREQTVDKLSNENKLCIMSINDLFFMTKGEHCDNEK